MKKANDFTWLGQIAERAGNLIDVEVHNTDDEGRFEYPYIRLSIKTSDNQKRRVNVFFEFRDSCLINVEATVINE